ncbi:retrovirus-related pol polyprotein from transposon TNT 1-94 [Tanacetum coccineum]
MYNSVNKTDHGREFDNEVQFGEFCNANEITHNFSAPRTPQSNGVVERKNRTLQEMSRTMLNEQSLPQKFWCNAVDTSTYILNRILIRAILGKTPYELLKGRKPTLDYFRVFGSKCFILNTKDYLTKFDPKSYEGIFLGYSQNSKAYIILNKHTRKVEESLNVTFDETPPPSKTSPLVDDDLDEEEAIKVTEKKNLENDIEDETLEIDEIVNIKESRNHPLENVIGNLNQRTLRSQAQNQSNFFCFISTIKPKNVNEALGDESWIVAMQEELNQFIANDIWELVPQPRNMTIIGTKWVFRNKLDENGIVSRNKAMILLAYACALDFKLFQMDVKSAFLNGFINEEVYMAQPPAFIDIEKPDHVYKLKKALYGLNKHPKLDIIFGLTCQDICDEFAKIMHDEFEMSMMGELNFFLGLQIKQMEDGIFFNQSKYIKEMLKKFGLEESKPMKTPMSSDTKVMKDEECESVDSTKYPGMIASLLYLTASRPDIMFSVCLCARFQEAPKTSHLEAKEIALAISTTEAEYVSAEKACQQALWMKQALIDYDVRLDDVTIMCDNKGATDLSKNPVQHFRTKHIKISHQFLRDNVQKGHISIKKVPPVDNIADILTKPLKHESFYNLHLEPKNVNEALTDDSWIVAMQEELNQFLANDVWELVPQPRNMTIIGTKWVFKDKLDENGIVSRRLGFIDFEKPDHVYKLKKALYGLKQAPKAWYDRLKAFLIKHEYKMGMVDNTLFTKKKSSNLIIVQIYVDDIIFGSTCQDMCDEFAKIMHDEFEMSMMGELNFFLGLQIKQMEDGIFFNQSKYIKEMLKKFGLEDSKPMKTPMSSDTKLTKDKECESVDSTKYRGMIGTTHLGLWYLKGTGIETVVYADSDHAGDYKQTTLAISTTEAEYVSAGKACQQALWMKQALIDYDVRLDDVPIMCDNKGAIDLSKNPV